MDTALVIMVKQPAPGRVKTRLCPPLTPKQAADLYGCFLLDKIAQVGRVAAAAPYLAYTPPEAEGYFRDLSRAAFSLVPQEGKDLGERLGHLSTRLLTSGHPGVVIIDSDTPSLPDGYLTESVEWIANAQADAVFGPAEDGGYYLVGLRRPAPALFQGIAWSTAAVLKETLSKAAAAGFRVHLLPRWFDVDTGRDLARLRRHLTANGTRATHTRAFLQHLPVERAGEETS